MAVNVQLTLASLLLAGAAFGAAWAACPQLPEVGGKCKTAGDCQKGECKTALDQALLACTEDGGLSSVAVACASPACQQAALASRPAPGSNCSSMSSADEMCATEGPCKEVVCSMFRECTDPFVHYMAKLTSADRNKVRTCCGLSSISFAPSIVPSLTLITAAAFLTAA